MEEVDNIIIHSLRQIDCDIGENVVNLGNFTTEMVVESVVKCLEAIRPGIGLSTLLPTNMAARFRMGATLAQICLDLGYRGDIGYQTFLYSSETDLRRVFMFLIEKLPKESDKAVDEPTSKIALLEKSIATAISISIASPWLPHYCYNQDTKFIGRTKGLYKPIRLNIPSSTNKDEDYKYYCEHYQQSVAEQIKDSEHLLPSILSYNARLLHTKSTCIMEQLNWMSSQHCVKITPNSSWNTVNFAKFSLNERLLHSKISRENSTTPTMVKQIPLEMNEESSEAKVEKIEDECKSLKINIESIQTEIKNLNSKLLHLISVEQNEFQELKIQEEQKKIMTRSYSLLNDGETNMEKLEQVIETNSKRLIGLANQWEKHRVPLIQKYRYEREKLSTKANASQKKLDELRLLKEKERELIEECRNKDQQYAQLVTEVQKLSKETNRSAYTQRILEIINNVRKQKDEIEKVLNDTRNIKKEINILTGRLERSFAVVDELIFRDARINETSKKAYKLLATLHSDCSELVDLIEETGAIIREIRDLEEQIDTESAKNVGANLERITADLTQMKHETATLTVQLQNKKS